MNAFSSPMSANTLMLHNQVVGMKFLILLNFHNTY